MHARCAAAPAVVQSHQALRWLPRVRSANVYDARREAVCNFRARFVSRCLLKVQDFITNPIVLLQESHTHGRGFCFDYLIQKANCTICCSHMLLFLCPVKVVRSPHVQVHGLFVASMFGGILGSHFPGSIYMLQNLLFKAPCFVGSSVTARLEVSSRAITSLHSTFMHHVIQVSSISTEKRVVIWRSTITVYSLQSIRNTM